MGLILGEDGQWYETADEEEEYDLDDYPLEDRLAALENAIAMQQQREAQGYYEEDEEDYEPDEEEFLNAVAQGLANLGDAMGRKLTDQELSTLSEHSFETGEAPSEAYVSGSAGVELLDVSNEDDRVALGAQVLEEEERRQEARDIGFNPNEIDASAPPEEWADE